MSWYVEIIDREDSTVVKRLGPYAGRRLAYKAQCGVNINLDYDRFYTNMVEKNE